MKREQEIYELYNSGLTYREIGEKMGLSVERVRQLRARYERYKDNEIYIFMADRFDPIFTGTVINRLAGADIRTIKGLKSVLKNGTVLGPQSAAILREALGMVEE